MSQDRPPSSVGGSLWDAAVNPLDVGSDLIRQLHEEVSVPWQGTVRCRATGGENPIGVGDKST